MVPAPATPASRSPAFLQRHKGARRAPHIAATFATGLLLAAGPASADLIWAPMWDIRTLPMNWEVRASGASTTFFSHFADGGTFNVYNSSNVLLATVNGGIGEDKSTTVATVAGEIYRMEFSAGFHV